MTTKYLLIILISTICKKTHAFNQGQNYNPSFNPNSSNQISNNYHDYSQELSKNLYQVDAYINNQNNNPDSYQNPYSYQNPNSNQNNFNQIQNQNSNLNQNNQFDNDLSLISVIEKLSKPDKASSILSNISSFIPSLSGEGESIRGSIFSRLINLIRNRFKKDKFQDNQSGSSSCDCSGISDIDYYCVLYTDDYEEAYKNKCLAECEREVEDVKSISSGKCGKNKNTLDIMKYASNQKDFKPNDKEDNFHLSNFETNEKDIKSNDKESDKESF